MSHKPGCVDLVCDCPPLRGATATRQEVPKLNPPTDAEVERAHKVLAESMDSSWNPCDWRSSVRAALEDFVQRRDLSAGQAPSVTVAEMVANPIVRASFDRIHDSIVATGRADLTAVVAAVLAAMGSRERSERPPLIDIRMAVKGDTVSGSPDATGGGNG